VGARVRRVYDRPQTPLERVRASSEADPGKVAQLHALRERLDPFALSQAIDEKLECLLALAHSHPTPRSTQRPPALSAVEQASLRALSDTFGIPVDVGTQPLAGRRRT
jgi:hypothetical protein